MRVRRIAKGLISTLGLLILAVVLVASGVILTLYSSWGQRIIKDTLTEKFSSTPGNSLEVNDMDLRFPLRLTLQGVSLVQQGDTMVKADTLRAHVALLPLLMGKLDINDATLVNGFYQMGAPDSALWLRISARRILLKPASVTLAGMHITLDNGLLQGASVDLTINPVTTPADTTSSKTSMLITLKHLDLDDLTYRMHMLPTIDSLGTNIQKGTLTQGEIDLEKQTVKLRSLIADALSAAYISPDSTTIADTPVPPQNEASTDSAPWIITIDSIRIKNSEALYTTRGVIPQPGLDFAYIQAHDMSLDVTNFYNQASTLSLPIVMHGTERCGLTLDASGTFATDSTAMYFRDFNVNTPLTHLRADGLMGMGDLMSDPSLPLRLTVDGELGVDDMKTMFPAFGPYITMLQPAQQISAALSVAGTTSHLDVSDLKLSLPHHANIHARGQLFDIFQPDRLGADISIEGHIIDVKSIMKALSTADMTLAVPPMTLAGRFHMHQGDMSGKLNATTLGGHIALDASLKGRTDAYDVTLNTEQFPLHAFLPDMALGNATLSLKAHGAGFDLMSPKTQADVEGNIKSLIYNGYDYHDISLKASLNDGHADIDATVDTEALDAQLQASGNLTGNTYEWTASIDGRSVDLYAMKLSTTPMFITATADAQAQYTPATGTLSAELHLPSLFYRGADETDVSITNVSAKLFATDSTTNLDVRNRDLIASASAAASIDSLMRSMDHVMAVVDSQISERKVNVDTLQKVLPRFGINVVAGSDNLINDILGASRMSISHLQLSADNDSVISLNSNILGINTGSMLLDTINVQLSQQAEKMHMIATMDNRPGNMDNWAHVRLDGLVNADRLSVRVVQQDINKRTGYDLGAIAAVTDSAVTARFFPLSPVIGYKKWSVNLDNFLYYNFFTHHIDANLKMKGDDSSLQLFTDHHHVIGHELAEGDSINNVTLKISDIHLADWISFNPFAPPISGNLSADINVAWDGGANINGDGQLRLDDFYYDRRRVASLLLGVDVNTNLAGTVKAQASLDIDGERAMALVGNLNDKDADMPFDLDLTLIEFPLSIANPFLPVDVAQLSGMLNGKMAVTGRADNPKLNGDIAFEHAFVKAAITNTSYAISDVKIPVVDNVVTFKGFTIKAANDNPLSINGTVNMQELTSPRINLKLAAKNILLVNTQSASRNALIYGKAYLDLDASVQGNMRFMQVNAKVDVLSGTNVSYRLLESADDFTNTANQDMVKFVNLNDTTAVVAADSIANDTMLMMIDAQLNIQQGTTVTVDLPTGQRDKVQIHPTGYLTYTQTPLSDGRMIGRIDLNSGFVRYTMPVIGSEKYFTFDQGSYVVFNGDMLNPVLNIHATDATKVNVTQEGQNSRLVNFNIMAGITGTLEQMDVKFDLSTDDDIAVANELQSMSPEQRASQAMNMLLYNMYTGPGSSSNINIGANPLFSFLESQINNWAANNIKGVDLTFGIDQYNQRINGASSSAMNYSYQVSKSLFNDRFKIVVGGNYTTDANADENLAENLINDISFEYFLNKQQTMLIRIFRHVGYVSILEGEITQTGVGFVYRRKLDRLANMLPKFMRPKERTY